MNFCLLLGSAAIWEYDVAPKICIQNLLVWLKTKISLAWHYLHSSHLQIAMFWGWGWSIWAWWICCKPLCHSWSQVHSMGLELWLRRCSCSSRQNRRPRECTRKDRCPLHQTCHSHVCKIRRPHYICYFWEKDKNGPYIQSMIKCPWSRRILFSYLHSIKLAVRPLRDFLLGWKSLIRKMH